jgi:hypothetical protein
LNPLSLERSSRPRNISRITKLIIQIPAFNEKETLSISLGALPREVPGVDVVE